MDIAFLMRGFIIGFSIAAPVGPISLLCMRRTLAGGQLSGIVSGLGAATADALFGCVAAFGLTFISSILIDQQIWLRLAGGLFLFYMGVRSLRARPAEKGAIAGGKSLIGAYVSTLFLTLTNPMTILSFAAFFYSFGFMSTAGSNMSAGALVMGVFIGSLLWWLILCSGVGLFRERFTQKWLLWVNRISGTIIIGFGLAALLG
ncbi:LysE type translocator [uncultured archaeon]|nr:LysE type translocator [uncultured archaeon]